MYLDDHTKKFHYPIKFSSSVSVGLFEISFNRNSDYIYKGISSRGCECYFIRRQNWFNVIQDLSPTFKAQIKRKAFQDYNANIFSAIESYQDTAEIKQKLKQKLI